MCGLVGFVGFDKIETDPHRIVSHMASAIRHRGPDDSGAWVDAAAEVALAHCRLSIVDLSPAGHQPMLSACGRYAIVFNGEIYNHSVLKTALESEGGAPAWRGHSDTEVLLAAIARWGIAQTLVRCVGMFAFAVLDRHLRRLHLARDRVGEKPLYDGRIGGAFAFSSELKALTRHPQWRGNDRPQCRRALLALQQRAGTLFDLL